MAGGREKESRQKITPPQPEKTRPAGFFQVLLLIRCQPFTRPEHSYLSSTYLSYPAVMNAAENEKICGFLSPGGVANLTTPPTLRRVTHAMD